MTEETQPEPNIVEQAKTEREALEKIKGELIKEREKIEQLRAEQILSGKTDAGTKQNEKKELSAKEYADKVLRGEI